MLVRLEGTVDPRDLKPFTYPPLAALRRLQYRSVCLGSFIPWDTKRQSEIIQRELGWQGDDVENVPTGYRYEKIECAMQGFRDYLKYIKRGYTRPTHLASLDIRNGRLGREEALQLIPEYEGRRPPSLDLFLEYVGLTEEEFLQIAMSHTVSPISTMVSLNTFALERPDLVTEAAEAFGAQCVVLSIDYRSRPDGTYRVWTRGGTCETAWDPVAWAREGERRGAGEILLTSIERDGTGEGLDLELTRRVAEAVSIPVISSGGSGLARHFVEGFREGRADAVATGTFFCFRDQNPMQTRAHIRNAGIPIRLQRDDRLRALLALRAPPPARGPAVGPGGQLPTLDERS